MDWIRAILFFGWFELLSLPLRLALAGSAAPADVRRLLSRVGGPVLLLIPLWFAGHLAAWPLGVVFGLVWVAFAIWVALQLGRTASLGPAVWLGYTDRGLPARRLRSQIALDALTFALFLGVVAWRRWVPEMTTYTIDSSAAEKFMNAMIWWSTWHAAPLPPDDYWLAGHQLTYYYWGHWHWSWIGRVGGFPPQVAITLAFARMVTLSWEAMVLLGRAFGLRLGAAAAAALAAAWGGNPSALVCAWQCWQPPAPSGWSSLGAWWSADPKLHWQGYDFWKPSRAIANSVVDEFPAFSTILGDFHSHHLALPWIVAAVALLVAGWRWSGLSPAVAPASPPPAGGKIAAHRSRAIVWLSVAVALALAASLANTWLVPLIAMALVPAVGWPLLRPRAGNLRWIGWAAAGWIAGALLVVAGFALIRGGEAIPLASGAPPTASWIDRLPVKPLPAELRSGLAQLWSLWGLAVLPILLAAALRLLKCPGLPPAVFCPVGLILIAATAPRFGAHIALAWLGVAVCGVSLATGRRPWLRRGALNALLGSCAILAALEIGFVDDSLGGEYERYNSYFKLSYPVWPVLMVVAGIAVAALWRGLASPLSFKLKSVRYPLLVAARSLAIVWLLLLAVYPALGLASRVYKASMLDDPPRRPTLDAFDFLDHRRRVRDDELPFFREAAMLRWIRDNLPAGDAVAEAAWVKKGEFFVGGYDYNGRVASLAGHPVPLGWAHHERQWRGEAGNRLTAERREALDRLYKAPDPETMRAEARALNVRWVLYGVLEHDRYATREKLGPRVLINLSKAARLAAAFPEDAPAVFLFDFGPAARKMDSP
jgi:YYY domain-containing protein